MYTEKEERERERERERESGGVKVDSPHLGHCLHLVSVMYPEVMSSQTSTFSTVQSTTSSSTCMHVCVLNACMYVCMFLYVSCMTYVYVCINVSMFV